MDGFVTRPLPLQHTPRRRGPKMSATQPNPNIYIHSHPELECFWAWMPNDRRFSPSEERNELILEDVLRGVVTGANYKPLSD
ncbi:hypothetical protein Ddc_15606 [Ditylenchus destructor]|nr:hypothetical protein Ddc_15606 [Ditylenchus destructor]